MNDSVYLWRGLKGMRAQEDFSMFGGTVSGRRQTTTGVNTTETAEHPRESPDLCRVRCLAAGRSTLP